MTDTDDRYVVRDAVSADAPHLARFNRAMARETEDRELDAATVEGGVAAVLADPRHGFYLVADAGAGAVAGLLVTREWSDWRNGEFWWIQSVYVEAAHRGRGLYRRLHEAVVARARARGGVCGFRLYVERDNRAAQSVYERLGMSRTDYLVFEQPAGGAAGG